MPYRTAVASRVVLSLDILNVSHYLVRILTNYPFDSTGCSALPGWESGNWCSILTVTSEEQKYVIRRPSDPSILFHSSLAYPSLITYHLRVLCL